MNKWMRVMGTLALAAGLCASAAAAELTGRAAYDGSAFGQQSDPGAGGAYSQSLTLPAGAIVDQIRWWGYHGPNSLGSAFDNFEVRLDGVVQTGTLSVLSVSPFFDEYTLDIADITSSATTLEIFNDSGDVEWFWQSAQAIGNPTAPDASAVAFSIIGRIGGGAVPEPTALLLALAGLAAARVTKEQRRAG